MRESQQIVIGILTQFRDRLEADLAANKERRCQAQTDLDTIDREQLQLIVEIGKLNDNLDYTKRVRFSDEK